MASSGALFIDTNIRMYFCNEAHSLALEAIAKAHGQDRHDDLLRTDGDILRIDPLEHGTAHGGCRPDGAGDLPVIHILQMGEGAQPLDDLAIVQNFVLRDLLPPSG